MQRGCLARQKGCVDLLTGREGAIVSPVLPGIYLQTNSLFVLSIIWHELILIRLNSVPMGTGGSASRANWCF